MIMISMRITGSHPGFHHGDTRTAQSKPRQMIKASNSKTQKDVWTRMFGPGLPPGTIPEELRGFGKPSSQFPLIATSQTPPQTIDCQKLPAFFHSIFEQAKKTRL